MDDCINEVIEDMSDEIDFYGDQSEKIIDARVFQELTTELFGGDFEKNVDTKVLEKISNSGAENLDVEISFERLLMEKMIRIRRLSITDLSSICYIHMFHGCSRNSHGPEGPLPPGKLRWRHA